MQVVKQYLLSKPEAFEGYPFGIDIAVYKVKKKMFATLGIRNGRWNMNLKCDPEQAMMLRDVFDAVIPGYHMNKAHWNTIVFDGSIPSGEIERMIDHSYGLVVRGLRKVERLQLETRYSDRDLYGVSAATCNH